MPSASGHLTVHIEGLLSGDATEAADLDGGSGGPHPRRRSSGQCRTPLAPRKLGPRAHHQRGRRVWGASGRVGAGTEVERVLAVHVDLTVVPTSAAPVPALLSAHTRPRLAERYALARMRHADTVALQVRPGARAFLS